MSIKQTGSCSRFLTIDRARGRGCKSQLQSVDRRVSQVRRQNVLKVQKFNLRKMEWFNLVFCPRADSVAEPKNCSQELIL